MEDLQLECGRKLKYAVEYEELEEHLAAYLVRVELGQIWLCSDRCVLGREAGRPARQHLVRNSHVSLVDQVIPRTSIGEIARLLRRRVIKRRKGKGARLAEASRLR